MLTWKKCKRSQYWAQCFIHSMNQCAILICFIWWSDHTNNNIPGVCWCLSFYVFWCTNCGIRTIDHQWLAQQKLLSGKCWDFFLPKLLIMNLYKDFKSESEKGLYFVQMFGRRCMLVFYFASNALLGVVTTLVSEKIIPILILSALIIINKCSVSVWHGCIGSFITWSFNLKSYILSSVKCWNLPCCSIIFVSQMV